MLKQLRQDQKTGAVTGLVQLAKTRAQVPTKFATTTEELARRRIGLKGEIESEILVAARLMYPNSLKKLLTDDEYLKAYARRLAHDKALAGPNAGAIFFMVFKGDAKVEETDDQRTVLDLQYFADTDVITVQQPYDLPASDFLSLVRFSERWLDQRGLDKPLMPVLSPSGTREDFTRLLADVLKRNISALGFDMHGGFYYHALRTLEAAKEKRPDLWVHVFQVPPKIRFGRQLSPCSEGMMLPYFGVDSFSRWVVPPPPEPLTKDKINVFERQTWGVFKRKEWLKLKGKKLGCDCSVCERANLDRFFDGQVLTVLGRSKVHDHLAQREELASSADAIRKGEYLDYVRKRRYAKNFLDGLEKSEEKSAE